MKRALKQESGPKASCRSPVKSSTAPPSKSARRRLLLVDDHPMMRAGLSQLINKQTDLEVAFEAGSPGEAFDRLAEAKVDLLLTDMTMPGRSGIEFIKDVLALHPSLLILVISMHDEMMYAERVLRAGARGYIMKEAGGERLLAAIRKVLAGHVYASERMAAKILAGLADRRPRGSLSPIEKLTDREFEIFQLIGQGKDVREIAHQLHLSPKTVDVHRSRIKAKLALKDATAVVLHAIRWLEAENRGE